MPRHPLSVRGPLPVCAALLSPALVFALVAGCHSPRPLTSTAPNYGDPERGASEPASSPEASAPGSRPTTDPSALHPVRMHRPAQIGDEHLLAIESRETLTQLGSQRGQLVTRQTEVTSVSLRGRRRVLEVDEAGKVSLARIEIVEATQRSSQGARLLLSPGAVVLHRRAAGGGSIELDNGPLPDDVVAALRFPLGDRLAAGTDDDIFGTEEPQPVGATWPLHARVLASAFGALGTLRIAPQNVRGETHFDDVVDVDGVPCIQLTRCARRTC